MSGGGSGGGSGEASGVLGPSVQPPAWALRSMHPVGRLAEALRGDADDLRSVASGLADLLGDTARSLGWRSGAARAAQEHSQGRASQLRVAADRLDDAADALDDLRAAVDRFEAQADPWAAVRGPDAPPGQGAAVAALEAADQRVADDLDAARRALSDLVGLAAAEGWVAAEVPAGALALLQATGVLAGRAELDVLARLDAMPAGAAYDDAVRDALAGLSPDVLEALLVRHPQVAARLVRGGLPSAAEVVPGSAEAVLLAALSLQLPGENAFARIDRITAALASLGSDDRRRLALLYPAVLGNLDGAPLADRMAANRVAIAAAMDAQQQVMVELHRAAQGFTGPDAAAFDWMVNKGLGVPTFLFAYETPAEVLARVTERLALYDRLLFEEVPMSWGVAQPHQVLVFSSEGDGRIAELWGTIDQRTANLGVFVPGTYADLESTTKYSDRMRRIANADQTAGTATIAWLGADFPDAVGSEAPDPAQAEAAGPALRDFVYGLGARPGVDITAVGHSYGGGAVVGVAEREGLQVDRVLQLDSAGLGRDVASVRDYPSTDPAGTARQVDRYVMTAPGSPISVSQGAQYPLWRGGPDLPMGHGADPDEADGLTRLATGRLTDDVPGIGEKGDLLEGWNAHKGVATPGTTAFENILRLIQGQPVIGYEPPTHAVVGVERYPYEDPDYDGPLLEVP